jgi:NADH-quinone oxidoreductase subunit D
MVEHHIKLPEGSMEKTTTTLNLGPTHPATHGVFQNILELDGERIVSAEQTVGYIHRAFEKIAERRPLYQITPLTDRLNYCSSPINNMGWHITCEKLLSVKTPKRVDYLRIIIMELARISDHLICNSVVGVDSGAYTGFLYVMQYRELIYEIYEEVCGSRLTTNIDASEALKEISPIPHFKNWKNFWLNIQVLKNENLSTATDFYGKNLGLWWNQCRTRVELWIYRTEPARYRS